jgi:hypothetical protein
MPVDLSGLSNEIASLMAQVQGAVPTSQQPAPAAAVVPAVPVAPVVAAIAPPVAVAPPAVVMPAIPVPPAPQILSQEPPPAVPQQVVVAAPVPVPVALPAPVAVPVAAPQVSNDEESNDMTSAATEKVDYPKGTPRIVIKALDSGQTPKQIITQLFKARDEHPEIDKWLAAVGKKGRAPAALEQYAAVKKALREKSGVKPKPQPAKNAPSAEQAAENFGVAASMVAAMSIPTPPAPVVSAGNQPPQAAPIQVASQDAAAALVPGKLPLKRFVNENTGRVFLMWTDFCAATLNNYSLRFRHFTVGENSKPGPNPVPKAYLLDGEKVKVSLSGDEFIAMLYLINEIGKSGKMAEVFQMLQKLAAPAAG